MYWILESEKYNREALIKEADEARLAKAIIAEGRDESYNPALAWVGRRMIDVGLSLTRIAGDRDADRTPADLN